MAPRPTPIGLLGIGGADASGYDERPLITEPPRHWRFAKYALGVVVPVGALFAAHRLSEPEGFDAVETNTPTAAAVAPMTTISPAGDIVIREPRPPARLFRADAFGHSGAARVRITLPNEPVDLPIEFGDFEETDDGRCYSIPCERSSFNGLLDLHVQDVFQLFRIGEVSVTRFRTTKAEYACFWGSRETLKIRKPDLVLSREERDRFEAKSGFRGLALGPLLPP